jgi:hypothetical protein
VIVHAEFADAQTVDAPAAVFTGGTPGSGKSHLKALLGEEFGGAGYADIGTDTLRVYHPRWRELLETDDVTAGHYTQLDAQAWVARSVTYAIERRLNVILDSTLSRATEVTGYLERFQAHAYATELAFVAAPLAMSWLGNLERYERSRSDTGHGRMSLREPYEATAAQIVATVAGLEAAAAVDRITVYRRGGEVLYRNTRRRSDGAWATPARATQVIEHERQRVWTPVEGDQFLALLDSLTHRMQPDRRPDLLYAVDLVGHRLPTAAQRARLATRRAELSARGTGTGAGAAERAATVFRAPSSGAGTARAAGRDRAGGGPGPNPPPPRSDPPRPARPPPRRR